MPSRFRGSFPKHATAADKRARVEAAMARLGKQPAGHDPIRPGDLPARAITTTFWGKAWCENLQAYADLAYRLDRGRSYVRSGAVVDLKIDAGQIQARVAGTRLYKVQIAIRPLAPQRWRELARSCTGRIGSLVALLRGQLPDEVMLAVTDRATGLFPKPTEMDLHCDCPDEASLCKHLAATLYGIGARLDNRPELLFLLRGVDPKDLVEQATAGLASAPAAATPALSAGLADLGALFGIELADEPMPEPARETAPKVEHSPTRKPQRKPTRKTTRVRSRKPTR